MNKDLCFKFSQFGGLSPDSVSIPLEEMEPEIMNDDLQMVLNEIFSVDPITGVPKGDIAYYLSENGNSQVKEWIMTNLLRPRSVASGSSIEGLTDDLIAEMSRQTNEDFESYSSRLASIRDEAIKNIEEFKKSQNAVTD